MRFDYPFFLTLFTLMTGLVVLFNHWVLKPKQVKAAAMQGNSESMQQRGWLVEYSAAFFPVLLFVLLFRSFLFEPYRIPSGSMLPNLLVGDFILVNKYNYGLRLPVLDTKFFDVGQPERGDVMVFHHPKEEGIVLIKRVIGLPGDHIAYRDKRLFINGEAMSQEPLGIFDEKGSLEFNGLLPPQERMEHLDGVEHRILLQGDIRATGSREWIVPDGHYFMMGDNRDSSIDSRVWGFAPEENIVGQAVGIWMHFRCERGFDCFDFSRIGDSIK